MIQTPRNSTKVFQVAVLFEEPEITDLFSSLIMLKGVRTRILQPGEDLLENERIVTEPQYLNHIPENKKETSLLIGNSEALKCAPGMTLSRPLTEMKVMQAIDKFLS